MTANTQRFMELLDAGRKFLPILCHAEGHKLPNLKEEMVFKKDEERIGFWNVTRGTIGFEVCDNDIYFIFLYNIHGLTLTASDNIKYDHIKVSFDELGIMRKFIINNGLEHLNDQSFESEMWAEPMYQIL
jgi:hypothetical protein